MTERNLSLKKHINNLFGDLLTNPDYTEIVINKFEEIWLENQSGFKKGSNSQNNKVTKSNCEAFATCLASHQKQQFSEKHPILGATLETGERVQILMPPACDKEQFSITIRKPSNFTLKINDFKKQGYFDEIKIYDEENVDDENLRIHLEEKDYAKFLTEAVKSGAYNIVIAGATGSGKTTLMKALINHIPINERLLSIEDVRELFLPHSNMVNMLYPSENTSNLTATKLLKSSLRMKPDRILLAELRGGEAFDYINVISSGHGGSITSIHAGNKEEALQRLTLMSLQNETGSNLAYGTVKNIVENTIDIIVHVGKVNGRRCITELYWNKEGY